MKGKIRLSWRIGEDVEGREKQATGKKVPFCWRRFPSGRAGREDGKGLIKRDRSCCCLYYHPLGNSRHCIRQPGAVSADDGSQRIAVTTLLARSGGAGQGECSLAANDVTPLINPRVGSGGNPVIGIVTQGQESIVGFLLGIVVELPPALPHNGVRSCQAAITAGRDSGVKLRVGFRLVVLAARLLCGEAKSIGDWKLGRREV